MLEPELVIGLKVLAQVHAGSIAYNCSTCTEETQAMLGCSGVAEEPIAVDEDMGEFYSCPIRWITPVVYDWYDEYSYYQVFTGAAPSYNEVSSRFWECVKVYKAEYDKHAHKKNKPADREMQTDNNLSKLRSNFKR